MVYRVPLIYTALRPFTANGVVYERGDVVTAGNADDLNLGVLISARYLLAVPDPYARRGAAAIAPQPTYIAPGAIPSGEEVPTGTITVAYDSDPGDELRVILDASFPGPMAWNFGDGYTDYQNDSHTAHPYGAPGTYLINARSGLEAASVSVTVPDPGRAGDVPNGTIAEIKNWVGEDSARAAQALESEESRETPRVTLLEWLLSVIIPASDEQSTTVQTGQDAPAV